MRSLEKGRKNESLEKNIARVAFAYGFTSAPARVSRKTMSSVKTDDAKTAAAVAVLKTAAAAAGPVQVWGAARSGRGTTLSFGTVATKAAIGNAMILKTALSVAELIGFADATVAVSSVGDAESKKRFARELGNFFKKQAEHIPQDLKSKAVHDPEGAYRELVERKDPLVERAPRTIDYLSENSRKVMLETLSLFEAVNIPYSLDPRMEIPHGTYAEMVFAIETAGENGEKTRLALGGRLDEAAKKYHGISGEAPTALSISIPKDVDLESANETPSCFVIHVGEAAKLRAFILLEGLWKARIAATQILMAENFREQMERGKASGAKYLAIIGQREALDNTIIVRNIATQMQVTLPLEKLEGYVSRGRN